MAARRLAAGAAAVAATLTACATLPTSGTVRPSAPAGAGGQVQGVIQVVPVPPGPAWQPTDVVRGFLAASADNLGVARQYLTDGPHGLARSWRPCCGATVIDSPFYNPITVRLPKIQTHGPQREQVNVTGRRLATLRTAGNDQAGSVVVAPAATTFEFQLVQVSGVWRIDQIDENNKPAPPSLLLLTRPDFDRDYVARNIYYLPASPATSGRSQPAMSTATVLVPDPVYVRQTGLLSEVKHLVRTLINPPATNSWLYGAATTAFPKGTTLAAPVQVLGGAEAVVDLGGTALRTDQAQRRQMAAQLAWSLAESPYGSQAVGQIRSVELKFGSQIMQAEPSDYAGWVPRGPGTPLYYQAPASQAQPAEVMLRASPSESGPVALPKSLGGQMFDTMAVSGGNVGSAVLAGCRGTELYLMPQARAGQTITKRLPAACTSLSWDAAGNLWIAADAGVLEMPGAAAASAARAALVTVQVPALAQPPGQPVIDSLSVAPDGVRVAMIARSGSSRKILITGISSSRLTMRYGPGGVSHRMTKNTYLAQTDAMLRVGSDLADPVALTWLDADHLLVLDRSAAGHTEIYEVPLNGGASSEIVTPAGATSLAVSWPAGQSQPLLVVGIAASGSAPARIEESRNAPPNPNPDWLPIATGVTPVYPG